VPINTKPEDALTGVTAVIMGEADGADFGTIRPLAFRFADPIKGQVERPIAVVPALSITVDEPVQFVPANRQFDRVIRVNVRSSSDHARTATISLQLPPGLTTDSASRTIGLPDYAGRFGAESEPQGIGRRVASNSPMRTLEFRVRGTLAEGRYTIAATAESEGKRFTNGFTLVDYDHIRPQRLFRDATVDLSAVDVKL